MSETQLTSDLTERIVEASYEPWTRAWTDLDERAETLVLEPLRQGLERHREVVEAAGLAGEAPSDWGERTERLLEYRRAVGSGLLQPLAQALAEPGPAGTLLQLFTDALESARAGAAALPSEATAEWPAGALDPHPSDGLGRRLGKVLARGVSAARKTGRPRTLPLRSVALRHLSGTLAPQQDEAVAEAIAAWTAWVGELEKAWIEWADAALPALLEAEHPDEEASDHWAAVRDAALRLDERLSALLQDSPHAAARGSAESRAGVARGSLGADVAVAGSFLYSDGTAPTATLRTSSRIATAAKAWERDVSDRLQLYSSLLGILAGASAVQRRVIDRCREGALARAQDLVEVASRLRELRGSWRITGVGLREQISALDAKVPTVLEATSGAVPSATQLATTLTEASDSAVEALLAVVRQAPASLSLHDEEEQPPTGHRKAESRPLPLQELARQSFDALRIERIRSSTEGLLAAVRGVRTDLEGLPEVYSFARDEAVRELDSGEPGSDERAVELIGGALDRMADSLETRIEDLERAIGRAQAKLAAEITEGSSALLGRVGAGRMRAQLLAARSRAADLFARLTERWGPPVRRTAVRVRAAFKGAIGWISGWVAKGAALLGREPAAKVASARAIQTLAEVESVIEGLPLVYQRLFTLDPISDPALLAGRDAQLANAMERWGLWHRDEGIPLIVRGRQRSGITSFLRAFGSGIQADGHTCVAVTLSERYAGEAPLAQLLTRMLELPPASTLDEVARSVFAAEPDKLPGVVTVDNLEHVYTRVPKGTDLAERLLTLMAETEPRIFWVGGVTSSAWQLITTAEPTAVSQVDVMDLPPLGGDAVREAILARHKRSGLDVRYEESVTASARLRRRLRRFRDKKGFKKMLEDEYFEQLNRAAGGYLGLALFLWLKSAEFDPEEGVVMKLPERPDFSVLDQLSLTQNFTLKAFLEHRTLSLEEHDRIFRLPRHESFQIVESLRNRQLIQEVPRPRDEGDERSDIEVDLRYRVRPLLTGAVIAHLQGRNIVH